LILMYKKNYDLKLIENYWDNFTDIKKNELNLIENYFVVSEFSRKHAYDLDKCPYLFEDWKSVNLISISERKSKNNSPERGLFCNKISFCCRNTHINKK